MSFELVEFIQKNALVSIFVCSIISGVLVFIICSRKFQAGINPTNSVTCSSVDDKPQTNSIAVDVSGAVKHPGVYELLEGSRVVDALGLGGGVDSTAAAGWISKNINLASLLKDQQKLYVPFVWDLETVGETEELKDMDYKEAADFIDREVIAKESSNSQDSNLISVNKATLDELDTLPGIGSAYAQKIIDNRPYSLKTELISKAKLSQTLYSKIQDMIGL